MAGIRHKPIAVEMGGKNPFAGGYTLVLRH